ncbi:MAG: peptidoglycan DD-metalloendopeptidase family protein [Deltaproteobacteria bacterium]|nr:peptidoglycan DD-metalloendopeptidase family protein [Deltaproteobacteria bacterium]
MTFDRNHSFFLDGILHSYSQILFSEDRGLGAMLLISTFIHPFAGFNGLIGALFINFFACKLGHEKIQIRAGVFGFNGILFGMALSLYSRISHVKIILLVTLFSILLMVIKTWVTELCQKRSLPFLSIPFVLMTWIVILSGAVTGKNAILLSIPEFGGYAFPFLAETFLKNMGHIIFSPNVISGLLVVAALVYYSRIILFISILSFAAIIGLAYIVPEYYGFVINDGFNAILTAIAIGGIFFTPGPLSLLMAVIASLFTAIIGDVLTRYFSIYNISSLTASFNIATLLFIYAMQYNFIQTGLFRIFIPGSPEENYKRFIKGIDNSGKTDRNFILPFMGWWFVSQGIDGRHTHQGIYKWGLDFIVTDQNFCSYRNNGVDLEDHFCFNKPVTSPGNGLVYAVESSTPDNPVTRTNLDNTWGNYVIIQHHPTLFSILCHLGQKKISVYPNTIIKAGDYIGNTGSSGLAPYPHLHLQFQAAGVAGAPAIPVHFSDYLVKRKNHDEYVPLGIPEEKQIVSNIPVDINLKDIIGFELGETKKYELRVNSKKYTELWTCDMDSKGILFIESSLYKDRLFFLKNERSISFIEYVGGKNSGLHLMSLAIDKIPFYTDERLRWQKNIPYSDMLFGIKAFLWEPILPFLNKNFVRSTHTFQSQGNQLTLSSKIFKNTRVPIAKRWMTFDKGLTKLTFVAGHKEVYLKRIET